MGKNTKMRIASISKTFLATVVLQLWEEKLLSIDHNMNNYLHDSIVSKFPYGDEVTIRQLLNHSSGIPDFEDTTFIMMLLTDPHQPWTPYELINYTVSSQSSHFEEPGFIFHYSNTNYILLGLITESVTGKSMEQNIRDRILTPLNLSNTFSWSEGVPQQNYAKGYMPFINNTVLTIDDQTLPMYFEWAHGQMISTAEDLYIFFKALVSGDLYIEESTLQAMLAFTPLSGFSYGLGIISQSIGLI